MIFRVPEHLLRSHRFLFSWNKSTPYKLGHQNIIYLVRNRIWIISWTVTQRLTERHIHTIRVGSSACIQISPRSNALCRGTQGISPREKRRGKPRSTLKVIQLVPDFGPVSLQGLNDHTRIAEAISTIHSVMVAAPTPERRTWIDSGTLAAWPTHLDEAGPH